MSFVERLMVSAPAILFALTVHEYAHGWVAERLGDPTARQAGRLTFNPLAHLDPIGTLMLFLVHFGWAKPVPVDPYNLRNPKRDMMWIALAGPVANILLAALCGQVLKGLFGVGMTFEVLIRMLYYGVLINLFLAVFNLLPIPPLDGSKILMGLLPPEQAFQFAQLERSGPLILIGVLMFDQWVYPILSKTIVPAVYLVRDLMIG